MTKLLIATCQPVLARGFETVLLSAGFEVSCVCDARELHGRFLSRPPDIAILDYSLLPGTGIVDDLLKAAPRCRLLLLSRQLSAVETASLERPGVCGVLPPTVAPADLLNVVRAIVSGGRPAAATPADQLGGLLSPMERQFMALVAQGIQDKEIAAMMHSTERHVSRMRRRVTRRLQVQGRCELALYGLAARNTEV